ncbi:MAG: S41 family peptidase [Desulfuromonadaceae bacterium]
MNILIRVLFLFSVVLLGWAAQSPAAVESTPPLWLRYPAISPDGSSIAFTYGGQIWRVSAKGGEAVPLTSGEFYSTRPVWSPDGTRIAFASKRHDNLDLFIMPASGGAIKRLTHHSANDLPYAFSPDGARIYFSSSRVESPQSVLVGTYTASDQLYTVPTAGGRSRLLLPTPALDVAADASGRYLLYDNRPVYENEWRKGGVSDGTRDIWLYDLRKKSHRKLTDFRGEDRDAVWSPDSKGYYYLSERSGSFNIWYASLDGGSAPEQITTHKGQAVRFLSAAPDGSLVYGLDGEIWLRPVGSKESRRIAIHISQNSLEQGSFSINALDYATELAVSRDGSQIAVIARGELFVVSAASGRTRRITSTPQHEMSVSFGPDGRSIMYTSERDGGVAVYEATTGAAGPAPFLAAGPIVERKIIDTGGDSLQPVYSPDGQRIAYLDDRKRIKVYNRRDGSNTTILPDGYIYSYVDGDLSFAWSPDGRGLVATVGSIVSTTDIMLLDASGVSKPVFISRNGYRDAMPQFTRDGKAVVWASGRNGLKQADSNAAQFDVYITYLTQEAYDSSRLSDEDKAESKKIVEKAWQPNIDGLQHRTRRLTPFSIVPAFFNITADNRSLVFISVEMPGRLAGYRVDLNSGALQQLFLKPLTSAGFATDARGEVLYSLGAGGIERTNLSNGTTSVIPFQAQIAYTPRGEMEYLFKHFWRLTGSKFYRPDMHGVDWEAARTEYAKFLPYIHTWEDFADLMGEMAGGLNASHMGCYYLPKAKFSDKTASLGIYVDHTYDGPGLRVNDVLAGGPADTANSALKKGTVVLAIDGEAISAEMDSDLMLKNRAGFPVQLTIRREDTSIVTQIVTPISQEQSLSLAYERWVEERKAITAMLSNGRIGYLHLSAMGLPNYQRAFGEIFGELKDKKAVVIDIRFNRGGNLHDQLIALFTGESYAGFTNRDGNTVALMPVNRWTRPSTLLANAGSYSDGSIFPHLYKRQKIGPVIGTGVPGTGTAVWWIDVLNDQIKYGIPQLGAKDIETGWFENQETLPDVFVNNDPDSVGQGHDLQLEAAVARLLESLK